MAQRGAGAAVDAAKVPRVGRNTHESQQAVEVAHSVLQRGPSEAPLHLCGQCVGRASCASIAALDPVCLVEHHSEPLYRVEDGAGQINSVATRVERKLILELAGNDVELAVAGAIREA